MTAKEQADAHWKYVGVLLEHAGVKDVRLIEYVYQTAFIHGWRHGVESEGGDHKEVGDE